MMMKSRKSDIEELPPAILQEILTVGGLDAVDLASFDASASVFRAPNGNTVNGFIKSITEAAAHCCCETHQVFESMPCRARLELLARCDGQWKRVLHFLESLERSSGRTSNAATNTSNNVLTAAGISNTLIVNKKGELIARGQGGVLGEGMFATTGTYLQKPKLISLPATATRIVQISANYNHAAFVTETGQVYTFGNNRAGCCGIGIWGSTVLKPTCVETLQNIPCQQVTTGDCFTLAVTKLGEVFSWGDNKCGQLGHGDTVSKSTPQKIDQFDGSDPVVQVSAGGFHSLAVTKSGKLFSWGHAYDGALGHDYTTPFPDKVKSPKRVEHGGFHGLFIVSAVAGKIHSVAIDHCGQVYRWGNEKNLFLYSTAADRQKEVDKNHHIPVLVLSSMIRCAVQVVAEESTFVLLDNGTVYQLHRTRPLDQWQGRCHATNVFGDRARSIACGLHHIVIVTKRGTVFGLGRNCFYQFQDDSLARFESPLHVVET